METHLISQPNCSTLHGIQLKIQLHVLLQTACTCIMHKSWQEESGSLGLRFLECFFRRLLFKPTRGSTISHVQNPCRHILQVLNVIAQRMVNLVTHLSTTQRSCSLPTFTLLKISNVFIVLPSSKTVRYAEIITRCKVNAVLLQSCWKRPAGFTLLGRSIFCRIIWCFFFFAIDYRTKVALFSCPVKVQGSWYLFICFRKVKVAHLCITWGS